MAPLRQCPPGGGSAAASEDYRRRTVTDRDEHWARFQAEAVASQLDVPEPPQGLQGALELLSHLPAAPRRRLFPWAGGQRRPGAGGRWSPR